MNAYQISSLNGVLRAWAEGDASVIARAERDFARAMGSAERADAELRRVRAAGSKSAAAKMKPVNIDPEPELDDDDEEDDDEDDTERDQAPAKPKSSTFTARNGVPLTIEWDPPPEPLEGEVSLPALAAAAVAKRGTR